MEVDKLKFNFDAWLEYFDHVTNSVGEKSANPESANSVKPPSGSSFKVRCKSCEKNICVMFTSDFNLKSHLRRKHKDSAEQILKDVEKNKRELKKTRNKSLTHKNKHFKTNVSQEQLNSMVVSLVCQNSLSFNILNSESMRVLLQSGFPQHKILNRRSFITEMDKTFDKMKENIRNVFAKLDFICLATDAWTSYRRYGISFYTIPGVNPGTANFLIQCWL